MKLQISLLAMMAMGMAISFTAMSDDPQTPAAPNQTDQTSQRDPASVHHLAPVAPVVTDEDDNTPVLPMSDRAGFDRRIDHDMKQH